MRRRSYTGGMRRTLERIALADDLIEQTPAAFLGSLGGQETAKRGPEYYARIAAMRKTKAGGRPRKLER